MVDPSAPYGQADFPYCVWVLSDARHVGRGGSGFLARISLAERTRGYPGGARDDSKARKKAERAPRPARFFLPAEGRGGGGLDGPAVSSRCTDRRQRNHLVIRVIRTEILPALTRAGPSQFLLKGALHDPAPAFVVVGQRPETRRRLALIVLVISEITPTLLKLSWSAFSIFAVALAG